MNGGPLDERETEGHYARWHRSPRSFRDADAPQMRAPLRQLSALQLEVIAQAHPQDRRGAR